MLKESICHYPYGSYAYPTGEDKLFIQLRAKKGDLDKVNVIYDGRFRDWDNNQPRYFAEMKKYSSDHLFDYFKAEIKYSKKKFKYYFLLDDGEEQLYYCDYGFYKDLIDHNGCFQYTYICEKDYFDTPDWVKNAVFYQIFPERFCNGDSNLNPNNLTEWNQNPESNSLYGGDLRGIINKLDYLAKLGIDAIYLTPIFESSSNHKYDIIDYMKVDPNFGDLETCRELVDKAHELGIKIIFDGVFNHTSDKFFAFQDILEKGKESEYKNWYYLDDFPVKEKPKIEYKVVERVLKDIDRLDISSHEEFMSQIFNELEIDQDEDKKYILKLSEYIIQDKVQGGNLFKLDFWKLWKKGAEDQNLAEIIYPNYETFGNGVWRMPKLKTANPEVRNYILDIARYWIEEVGIDGWRLDVADEIDHYFWREFRNVVKQANPEAYIVGEVWSDASSWLDGDQFDGVMNYLFSTAVWDFFCRKNISVNTFEDRLSKVRTKYKIPAQEASLNLLGSHDTERVLTIASGYKTRQKLAAAFQMTYLGVPMIYYGDEVGMAGGSDPDCRRGMLWDENKQDKQLLKWYKKLISIRKDNPALRTGDFELVDKDVMEKIYAFTRKKGNNQLLVIFNNNNLMAELEFDLNKLNIKADSFEELISEEEYKVKNDKININIKGYSVNILKARL
ncbi:alpha-glycosidase [Orenia marismortui]|uniref:alpha-glycosidase n=1 Tax=Orenia marismortui TaxID=46469 RepID=UPI000371BF45|nr:alpha-glycosidase [Orenia marismortui]